MNFDSEKRIWKEGIGYNNCLMSAVYPVGVILSMLVNAEYFTANLFMFPPAIVHGTAKIQNVIKFEILCLMGNIFGALIFAWIVGYWTVNLSEEGIQTLIASLAETRSIIFISMLIVIIVEKGLGV